jgi:hypothetical protein
MTIWRSYRESIDIDEPQVEHRSGFMVEWRGERCGAAFHEAGHAAARFAMGASPGDVVINAAYTRGDCGDVWASYSGYCGKWKKGGHDFAAARPEVPNLPPAPGEYAFPPGIKLGPAIFVSAGPCAEWKYRAANSLPQALKRTAASDRHHLADFAQIERNASGTNPAAFLEQAWRKAQRLLDQPVIWRAVDALANELVTGILHASPDDPRPGDKAEFVITAGEAEAIMEKAGIVRGAFAARLQEREGFRRAA